MAIVTGAIFHAQTAQDLRIINAQLVKQTIICHFQFVTTTHAPDQLILLIMIAECVNYANGDVKYVQILTTAQYVLVDFIFMRDGAIWYALLTQFLTLIRLMPAIDVKHARINGVIALNALQVNVLDVNGHIIC
jgi:hypothetical protein